MQMSFVHCVWVFSTSQLVVLTAYVTNQVQPRKSNCPIHEPLHAQNDETNGNVEFLQPYPVFAADVLLEIGMTVISAILSLVEHLQTIHFARTIFSKISATIALVSL
jgi:hypothetical protein